MRITIPRGFEAVSLPERVHQLLRHVIVAEGILEGQVEKVVGLDYVAKTVPASVAARCTASAVDVDAYVLRQLLHVLHPATFGVAIAYKPSYQLALTPDDVQYRGRHLVYRFLYTCENLISSYVLDVCNLVRRRTVRGFVILIFINLGS